LCDSAEEVARLQYELIKAGSELAVEIATDPFRAIELAARMRPELIVIEPAQSGMDEVGVVSGLLGSSPASRIVLWSGIADAERLMRALAAGASGLVLKSDGPGQLLEAIRSAAGGVVPLSATVAQMLGAEGVTALARVTALEKDLAAVRERVEQGASAKADFLANISHELRTPITVAKGISYVLGNPAVTETERKEFVGQLQASLEKLMGIVEEVITIAELERGDFKLNLAETDLAPIVRHSVEDVGSQYPDTAIEAQISPRLLAIADGPRIGSVVRELLDNACRYSPAGSAVELRARSMDEGIVVQVVDRGEGLQREVAARSFEEPFSTGEATLRKEKAGVGAGLHLARQLIVEHGGSMWTDPLPSGGTRVSFCIPSAA
jgi:signal transduction histidine kinase